MLQLRPSLHSLKIGLCSCCAPAGFPACLCNFLHVWQPMQLAQLSMCSFMRCVFPYVDADVLRAGRLGGLLCVAGLRN